MSEEPRREARTALPADDLPSSEVLDELLRAFSADAGDADTLRQIDLASPEVEELLAPTSPTPEPPSATPPEPSPADSEPPAPDPPADTESPPPDPEPAPPGPDASSPDTEPPPEVEGSEPTTIRIDASDDPPDAVYLAAGDPLLAASAGARHLLAGRGASAPTGAPADSTVFIDDQVVGEVETISLADASSATRIEPRLRERRIAVKRAVGRKRLRWVLLATVVLVVIVAVLAVLGSSLFAIEEVSVDGAVHTDPAALQEVVDDLEGTPVLRADTDRAEARLEAIPWVADARVSTQFPSGASIELRERTPVATYQGNDGRFRVIDVEGRVLDVLDAQPVEHLPINSPDIADLEPGQFTSQGFVAAANLVRALTPELRAFAESVTVSGNGSDLRLNITDGREVRFGPGRDLVTKLVRLQTQLEALTAGGFQYVDVSTNEVTTG